MSHPRGSEGASDFHSMLVKAAFPYLECAAGAMHSRLLRLSTIESRDYAPLLCMLASGKTWEGAYSRDRDVAA